MLRNLLALPFVFLLTASPAFAQSPKNIVETAIEAGSFNTLVAAVKAADLVETLSSPGPFTVFAPTDEAFGTLPKGTIAELLKPENKSKLAGILTYHVVSGRVGSQDALGLDRATTVAGADIKISLTEAGANINDARLVTTDIQTSNGVIHVIDRVLLPPAKPAATSVSDSMNHDQRSIARGVLHAAIQQGVPLYNSGHHGQCAEIYMNALQSVALMQGVGLSSARMQDVQHTLDSCRQMHSMTDRAWALRGRMDQLITEL